MALYRRHRSIVVLISVCLTTFSINELLAGSENTQKKAASAGQLSEFVLPSLSATHVNWHEPSGQQIMSSSIELSPYGLRVRELGIGSFHEMLQDFSGERGWLIDHGRSIHHRLEMVEMPEIGSASPGAVASFLGSKPCGLLTIDDQGPGRWRGRTVTAFHCVNDANDVLAIEFLDDVYRIVVFRRTVDGYVDELRGLTDRTFSDTHFSPPSNYRSVAKQEFFFGAPELQSYLPEK